MKEDIADKGEGFPLKEAEMRPGRPPRDGRRIWRYPVVGLVALVILIAGGVYLKKHLQRSDPRYYAMHQKMGKSYLRQGQWDPAIEEFKEAIKANPNSFEAHYGLGYAYFKQRKLEEAAQSYEQALTLSPERLDIQYSLGLAYQEMGRLEKALKAYQEILQKDPAAYQVYNNVGIIHWQMGDRDKAVAVLKKAIEIRPDYYPSYVNLARVYESQGKIDLARKQYEYVKKNASKRPETEAYARAAEKRLAALKLSKNGAR